MAEHAQIDLSKVIKQTTPLEELVANDLALQREKFNFSDEQWERIGTKPLFARRGLLHRRATRSSTT